MTNKREEFVSKEIDGKWVVVDQQLWEQAHQMALLSLVGSSRLAAGPFDTEEEAQSALSRIAVTDTPPSPVRPKLRARFGAAARP